jgi:hypothetical protein
MVLQKKEMVVRIAIVCLWVFTATSSFSQGSLELWLYDFAWGQGQGVFKNPVLIDSLNLRNDHPSFHPTDPVLYFTRAYPDSTIVFSFNYQSGSRETLIRSYDQLTHPRITPDKKFLSCLNNDNLVKYPIGGGKSVNVYNDTKLENYLWLDDNALLIIESGDPNTLQLLNLRPKNFTAVARHVGSVLQQSGKSFAFVHKLSVDSWSVKRINPNGRIEIIAETLPESEFFALAPDGKILMVSEAKLFGYRPSSEWNELSLESKKQYKHIRSIGLNPGGDKLFILIENN